MGREPSFLGSVDEALFPVIPVQLIGIDMESVGVIDKARPTFQAIDSGRSRVR